MPTLWKDLEDKLRKNVASAQFDNRIVSDLHCICKFLFDHFQPRVNFSGYRSLSVPGIVRLIMNLRPGEELSYVHKVVEDNIRKMCEGMEPQWTVERNNDGFVLIYGVDQFATRFTIPEKFQQVKKIVLTKSPVLKPKDKVEKKVEPPKQDIRVTKPLISTTPMQSPPDIVWNPPEVSYSPIHSPIHTEPTTSPIQGEIQPQETKRKREDDELLSWLKEHAIDRIYSILVNAGITELNHLISQDHNESSLEKIGIKEKLTRIYLLQEIQVLKNPATTAEQWFINNKLRPFTYLIPKYGIDDVNLLNRMGKSRLFAILSNDQDE